MGLFASNSHSADLLIEWDDNSDNENGFEIERSNNGGPFSLLATVDTDVVSFTDTGLTIDTPYSYRVRAFNAFGQSGYSNVLDVTLSEGGSGGGGSGDMGNGIVTGLTLVAADTADPISGFVNLSGSQSIHEGDLPIAIGAYAEVSEPVGSIKFVVNGQGFRTESSPPFTIAGDNGTVINAWNYQTDTLYQINMVAYSGSGGSGSVIDSISLDLTITSEPVSVVPSISSIASIEMLRGEEPEAIAFTLTDGDTALDQLSFEVMSSNQEILLPSNALVSGTGASRALLLTPEAGLTGSSFVSLIVSDGANSSQADFIFTVLRNLAPTIGAIADQSIPESSSSGAIAFTIDDGESDAVALVVSASSSNTTILPLENISLGGSGANRTISVTPAEGQTGEATVSVNVSDGVNDAETFFTLTVTPNAAPSITIASSLAATAGQGASSLDLQISDAETSADSLTVSVGSSNTNLIDAEGITLGGSGANRSLTLNPNIGQSGVSEISVTVSDGLKATTEIVSFLVVPAEDLIEIVEFRMEGDFAVTEIGNILGKTFSLWKTHNDVPGQWDQVMDADIFVGEQTTIIIDQDPEGFPICYRVIASE